MQKLNSFGAKSWLITVASIITNKTATNALLKSRN